MKVLIIYNSFIFASIRRKYFTYKRELYSLVTFVTKYDYLYKHLYLSIVVYTNYKSLIYFLSLDLYKEIYNH